MASPAELRELKAIIDWVHVHDDVRELSLKVSEVELFISRNTQGSAPTPAPGPTAPITITAAEPTTVAAPISATTETPTSTALAAAPAQPSAHAGELAADEVLITAPMVGIFYASPQPGAPSFVSVGERVLADTVLCIVEVMKLMNNIEAGVPGTVTRILVDNEQAVEYGQPLIVIRRDA